MRLSAVALPLLLLATSGIASAQTTIYSQSGTQACNPSCWTSHADAAGTAFRAYDDFTLGSGATITSVTWQGIYIPTQASASAPGPNTTTWNIGFYADSGNFPGAALFGTTLSAASVITTQIGTGTFRTQPVNIYSFTADLGAGFTAGAGTKYWFSPLSQALGFNPFFSWSPANQVVDNLTAQTDEAGMRFNRLNDRAFSLAAAVPEPGAWMMMLVGFGVIGGTMRRRVKLSFA